MTEHTYLQEEDMVRRGVEALVRDLGPVEAMRFLSLPRRRALDSVAQHRHWQKNLDQDHFFDQVFAVEEVKEQVDKG
jgi:hypothetical protein